MVSQTPIADVCQEIDDTVDLIYRAQDSLQRAIDLNHSVESVVYCRMVIDDNTKLLHKLEAKMNRLDPRISHEGKITPAMVEQARQVPIADLVEFNRAGFALCLWHTEKTPSMKLLKDNKVRCFSCNQTWDSIDVYRKINGKTFEEAVRELSCH